MKANRKLLVHLAQDASMLALYLSTGNPVLLAIAMFMLALRWDIVPRREAQERESGNRLMREIATEIHRRAQPRVITLQVPRHGLTLLDLIQEDAGCPACGVAAGASCAGLNPRSIHIQRWEAYEQQGGALG